ncbi:hypothetical protein OIE68_12630 [Nocardia vinacea]|uniref:Uncharacterized protein n=1 Tax=Nocardia vinacea TaxID=96468 RepID=A0ABZ1YVK4_9NOCA|nr:hypothetical protein OIE68_12630 [Nocardia vinacea]
MYSRAEGIRAVAVLAAALTVLCGCVRPGQPTPERLDLAALDVGSNSVDPLSPPRTSTDKYGRVLESMRMAEAALDPVEVDPVLTNGVVDRIAPLPTPLKAAGILAERVRGVLASHRMLAGFAVSGSDVDFGVAPPQIGAGRLLTVILLRFPDAMAAQLAARQMDATDAAISPDNVPVRLAEYPSAFVHWRPAVPTMGATIAQGSFVVSVLAGHTAPDQAVLTGLVRKAFDVQLPRLRDFHETAPDRFADLPLDRDRMLSRLLPYGAGHWSYPTVTASDTDDNAGWSSGLRISGVVLGPHATRLMKHLGFKEPIEIVAMNGHNLLERFPDAVSARRVFTEEMRAADPTKRIAAPAGVPDVYCRNGINTQPEWPAQVLCHVLYGRYTARIVGRNPTDAQQLIAAQYALLVHSG